MRDLFTNDQRPDGWRTKLSRFFLDLDARIDSGLYHARRWGRELYERFTVFMDRFHVAGCAALVPGRADLGRADASAPAGWC